MDEFESCYMTANFYRTKEFIVKQEIGVLIDDVKSNAVVSHDTYYWRTKDRDKTYEDLFAERENVNGKRLPTTMYTRQYVE